MYTLRGRDPKIVKTPIAKYVSPNIPIRKNHAELLTQTADSLVNIEANLSSGGSQILTYTHDLHVNVGGEYIGADKAPAVSVVEGYPVIKKIAIGSERTDIQQKLTPHVQSVPQSTPWGNYSIMACNKFNTVVGAGGIMMHTDGCIDISSGGRTTIASLYELNLTSASGNLNIICGHNVKIQGDTVTIKTASRNDQVVVDSNLGVTRNLTVHGSTYVDGELYCQHITAPAVARETSQGTGTAVFVKGTYIGWANVPGHGRCPVYADNASATILPHTHTYYTVAGDLHSSNSGVRDTAAAAMQSGDAGTAGTQVHGGTGLVS